MKHTLTAALGIVGIALGAGVVYLNDKLDAAQDALQAETAGRLRAESIVKSMESRYASLEGSYLELRQDRDQPGAPASAQTNAPASWARNPTQPTRNYSPGFEYPRPGFGEGRRDGGPQGPRRMVNPEMLRHLKLSDDQTEKLLQALTADQDKFRQALAANNGVPLDASTQAAMRADADQSIRDAIGDDKFQEYDDYRKNMAEHEQINRLNMRLTNQNQTPLTPDQEAGLFAVMKDEKSKTPAPVQSDYSQRSDFVNAYDQWRQSYAARTQTRAATILTPDQLKTFQSQRGGPFRGPPPNMPAANP